MLGVFNYNLPGGIQVNSSEIKATGESEVQEVMELINSENSPGYFLQWS
jgi:hypothetical protein